MAGQTFIVEDEVPDPETVEINEDVSGIETLQIRETYPVDTDIRLAYTSLSGVATQASGAYVDNGLQHRLVINGTIENVIGSGGNDFIGGNEVANVLFGDATRTTPGGSDTIGGADGNDTIYGGSDNDEIDGAADNDLLFGDAGDDTISGGAGIDTVQGGAGADSLSGGATAGDTVSYASSSAAVRIVITYGRTTVGTGGDAAGDQINGFDHVIGSAHSDVLTDSEKGTIAFGYNDNVFSGGNGADRLVLGGGNDRGIGGNQNDSLLGETGNDTLLGGAGNDLLTGGTGKDTLTGNDGADRFVFVTLADSTVTAAGRDSIADFRSGQNDKINLVAIDAKTGSGNQAFDFIGSARFTGDKGDLRVVRSGANVIVQGDVNGDKLADFAILVENVPNLRAGDFIL